MAQGNTYHQPRLFIEEIEVQGAISGSVSFPGNNQINTLSVSIVDVPFQNYSLSGKRVKFYLNNGSEDSLPFFSGNITDFVPSDNGVKLTCHDPRSFISGKSGRRLILTDKDNYDGFSIGAFLHDNILNKINITETIIGLDMLNDTSPIYNLSSVRGERTIYEIAVEAIGKVIDTDTDFLNPLGYFFDIIEGNSGAQLVIKKEKILTSSPSIIYSYADGLIDYKYKRLIPPNTAVYKGGEFIYTNRPTGSNVIQISSSEEKSRAEMRNTAIKQILLENQQRDEITITVMNGYDIGLSSIVHLDVDDIDIRGNHRLVGKNITFGNSLNCQLKLNKKPIKVSDYMGRIK